MPKYLGSVSDPKDLINKEYADNNYLSRSYKPIFTVYTHIVDSEVTSIPIPDDISIAGGFLLYQNGILINADIHYTISTLSNELSLIDYSARVGDIFTFISIS